MIAGSGFPDLFKGRAMGAGVIRAKRAWGLDAEGYLRGYYYHYQWEPDVWNIAACENDRNKSKPHEIDDEELKCSCGFYGYFDGSNDYHDHYGLPVSGMIEATGITHVGTKGIRTSRARIVALTVPDFPILPDAEFDRLIQTGFESDITFMSHMSRHDLGHYSFGDHAKKMTVVRRSSYDAFRRRYGSIPMFTDVDRMTAEYPEDAGDIIEL